MNVTQFSTAPGSVNFNRLAPQIHPASLLSDF
jgi:hypothetical protein